MAAGLDVLLRLLHCVFTGCAEPLAESRKTSKQTESVVGMNNLAKLSCSVLQLYTVYRAMHKRPNHHFYHGPAVMRARGLMALLSIASQCARALLISNVFTI